MWRKGRLTYSDIRWVKEGGQWRDPELSRSGKSHERIAIDEILKYWGVRNQPKSVTLESWCNDRYVLACQPDLTVVNRRENQGRLVEIKERSYVDTHDPFQALCYIFAAEKDSLFGRLNNQFWFCYGRDLNMVELSLLGAERIRGVFDDLCMATIGYMSKSGEILEAAGESPQMTMFESTVGSQPGYHKDFFKAFEYIKTYGSAILGLMD